MCISIYIYIVSCEGSHASYFWFIRSLDIKSDHVSSTPTWGNYTIPTARRLRDVDPIAPPIHPTQAISQHLEHTTTNILNNSLQTLLIEYGGHNCAVGQRAQDKTVSKSKDLYQFHFPTASLHFCFCFAMALTRLSEKTNEI